MKGGRMRRRPLSCVYVCARVLTASSTTTDYKYYYIIYYISINIDDIRTDDEDEDETERYFPQNIFSLHNHFPFIYFYFQSNVTTYFMRKLEI